MKREFKVTFSSLEEAWFDNEAIVIAETEEQAFNLFFKATKEEHGEDVDVAYVDIDKE